MPVIQNSTTITLNGTGSEFVGSLGVDNLNQIIYINGSATATSNYSISPFGSPAQNTTFVFKYQGNLNITSNSVTFTIFGTSITQQQLNNHLTITCYWNGSSWVNTVEVDFSQSNIISAANLGNIITSANITANSLNLHTVGQALSLTNTEIAANTIVGNQKLTALSVLDGQIGNVSGGKIIPYTIPNSGIATTVGSALKVTDSSGNMQDLALGANQLPMGNGTNVVPINISSICNSVGLYETINTTVSFDSGEQAGYVMFLPYNCKILWLSWGVIKAIAGTDDAFVNIVDLNASVIIYTIDIPASSGITYGSSHNFSTPYTYNVQPLLNNRLLGFSPSKTTPGGRAFISMIVQRT